MSARSAPGRSLVRIPRIRTETRVIDAIEKLKRLEGPKFSEVCEKHTFECYRMRADGCMQEVTVVILDAGPQAEGNARYYCHARTAEGREISSTLESSIDAALA